MNHLRPHLHQLLLQQLLVLHLHDGLLQHHVLDHRLRLQGFQVNIRYIRTRISINLSIHLNDGSREQAAGSGALHTLHAAFRSGVLLKQRNYENKVKIFSGLLGRVEPDR